MSGITNAMIEHYKQMEFTQWVRYLNRHQRCQQLKEIQKMAMSDYSDLEKEISGAPEPKNLPAGAEVKARIVSVRTGISDKNDCTWYSVVYDVPDDPMVNEFSDFFWELDRSKLTAKQFQRSMYQFKQFASAFGIDYSRPFAWEDDLPGKEGWVITGVRKSEEYGEQNTVKKYVAKR